MDQAEFHKKIGTFRKEKQKLLNNTYLWVSLSIQALAEISDSDEVIKKKRFQVPSKVQGKTILRKPDDIKSILQNAKDKDLYQSSFISIVALMEAFLSEVISTCLSYDQRRLRMNVSGSETNRKIEISEILNCEKKEDVIELIIQKQIVDLFYAGPRKQREYIENVCGVNIEEELWNKWFEYKATRDLYVHNNGIINRIYINKVGDLARGNLDEIAHINKDYFENSVADLKSLIGRIESRIRSKSK